MLTAYFLALAVMLALSWFLSGTTQRALIANKGFWPRMNTLAACWMLPLAAIHLAAIYAGPKSAKLFIFMLLSISGLSLIVGAVRVATMDAKEAMRRVDELML